MSCFEQGFKSNTNSYYNDRMQVLYTAAFLHFIPQKLPRPFLLLQGQKKYIAVFRINYSNLLLCSYESTFH